MRNDDVRHRVPGVVNADQEQTQRRGSDEEQSEVGIRAEEECRNRESGVAGTRQHRVPEPILPDRLVVRLATDASNDDGAVRETTHTQMTGATEVANTERHGAVMIAEISNAPVRCTTVDVPNALSASAVGRRRRLAMSVMTTNCIPISAAPDDPRMT